MLLAEKSVDEIANTLHISVKTAANTRYQIRAKLGVASDIELVRLALRQRIIAAEDIGELAERKSCHAQQSDGTRASRHDKSETFIRPAEDQIGRKHMPAILGSGEHRYRVVENWAKLPDGWNLTDVRFGRGRQQGPHLRLQPRRPSDGRVRPRG